MGRKKINFTKYTILESFALKGEATEARWEIFKEEVQKRAGVAKRIAEKYNLLFVPLQKGFEKLTEKKEESYWLRDGECVYKRTGKPSEAFSKEERQPIKFAVF